MGNAVFGKPWISPSAVKKEGTTLVNVGVYHLRDAHNIVGLQPEGYTPVTVVPKSSASTLCCMPVCWVAIPEGFTALVTKFGEDISDLPKDSEGEDMPPLLRSKGGWAPGYHCYMPWHRVSRLVSNQYIIFDSPVKDCKTEDNIPVNIDVLIVAEIIRPADFVYRLGPEKFDDLLRAAQEEVLRVQTSKIPVESIFDLHGAITTEWVGELNNQFNSYGVKIHHFTVRSVSIPRDMAQDFEDKTLYESQTLEKEMLQEMNRLNLCNDEARQKLREENTNAKLAAEEQTITTRAQLQKETREVSAKADKDIGVCGAQKVALVQDLKIKAELQLAELNAEMLRCKNHVEASINYEVGLLEAKTESYKQEKMAAAKMEVAAKIAEGRQSINEAEGKAQIPLEARRKQENELLRLDILEKLAQNKNILIATSLENNSGLAPDNSIVMQVAQQGVEAFRTKLAQTTAAAASQLGMGKSIAAGLVRPAQPDSSPQSTPVQPIPQIMK